MYTYLKSYVGDFGNGFSAYQLKNDLIAAGVTSCLQAFQIGDAISIQFSADYTSQLALIDSVISDHRPYPPCFDDLRFVDVTSNYVIVVKSARCDASGGDFTVTLPKPGRFKKSVVAVYKISRTGVVTIVPNAGELIVGGTVIDTYKGYILLQSDGENWTSVTDGIGVVDNSGAGDTTNVQYNNEGIMAGAEHLTIASDGLPVFGEISSTSAPTAGAKVFARNRAGRRMTGQVGPAGGEYQFQPFLGAGKCSLWSAHGNGSAITIINFGNNTTGSATARNVGTTGLFASSRRIGYVSSAVSGSSAGTRHGAQQFWRGSVAGMGGFFYVARFGLSSAAVVATQRSFVGMVANSTVMSNKNASDVHDAILGFCVDSADSTWYFIHGDSTGQNTKDALTGTFPPRDLSATLFEARIYCPANSATVYYSLEVLGGGSLHEGSTSTNIPPRNTLLSPQIWTNNGTTALAVGIDVVSQYLETDN